MTLQEGKREEAIQTNSDEANKEPTASDDAQLARVNSIDIKPTFYCGESEGGTRSSGSTEDGEIAMATRVQSDSTTPPRRERAFEGRTQAMDRKSNGADAFQYYSMESIRHRTDKEPLEDFEVFRQELEKITGCCLASRMRKAYRWKQTPSCSTLTPDVSFAPRTKSSQAGAFEAKRRRSRSAESFKELRRILGLCRTADRENGGEPCKDCAGEAHHESHRRSRQQDEAARLPGSAEVRDVAAEASPAENAESPPQPEPCPSSASYATVAQLLGEFYTENCYLFDVVKIDAHPSRTASRHGDGDDNGDSDDSDSVDNEVLGYSVHQATQSRIAYMRQRLDAILTRQKNELVEVLIRQETEWLQLEAKFGTERVREFRRKMRLEKK